MSVPAATAPIGVQMLSSDVEYLQTVIVAVAYHYHVIVAGHACAVYIIWTVELGRPGAPRAYPGNHLEGVGTDQKQPAKIVKCCVEFVEKLAQTKIRDTGK